MKTLYCYIVKKQVSFPPQLWPRSGEWNGVLLLTLGSRCVWLPCWCGGRREWRDDHPDWQWRNSGAWSDLSEIIEHTNLLFRSLSKKYRGVGSLASHTLCRERKGVVTQLPSCR